MYIYALLDPRTDEIRYIGKWRDKSLGARLTCHLGEARRSGNDCSGRGPGKNPWVRNLVGMHGVKPKIIPLIDGIETDEDLVALEIWMIAFGREIGLRLLNLTDGGDGAPGVKRSVSSIAKVAAFNTGKKRLPETIAKFYKSWENPERRKAASDRRKGVKASPESRARMSIAQKISRNRPEAKEKISLANRGKKASPSHVLNLSRAHGGRPFIDDLGNVYQTITEATKVWGSNIWQVLNGKRKQAKGRTFTYLDPSDPRYPEP